MFVKPACPKCQLFYSPKKNGYMFVEGMPEQGALPGTAGDANWRDYKLWNGDLWECRGCGAQVIVGVSSPHPISEHYMPDWFDMKARCNPQVRINDC